MADNLTPEQEAEVQRLIEEADVSHDQCKYEDAIALLDRTIKLDPKNALAWSRRGAAKNNLDQYAEAIIDLNKAIELDPQNASIFNNRGVAKNRIGQHTEAIIDLDTAIKLDPNMASVFHNRGAAKHDLGQYAEAIIDYDKAIKLDPNDAVAWNNRGTAKYDLGQHVEAIIDYDKSIACNPEYAPAFSNRGIAKNELGQFDEAIIDFNKAIELDQNIAPAWNNRGTAKAHFESYDEAIKDVEHALSLAPEDAEIRNNLAAIKAGRDAREAIKERIGNLDKSLEDVVSAQEEAASNYKTLARQRDIVAMLLIALIAGLFVAFIAIIYCLIKHSYITIADLDWTILYYWSVINLTLSAPLLLLLRIKSRDAEEAKVLSYSFLQAKAIEARMDLYQSEMTDEQYQQLMLVNIDNWVRNGPANMLVRLKHKNMDSASQHPAESILKRYKDFTKDNKTPKP